MTHFDGEGNLEQVDFVTLNGAATGADWRPATGTYNLDANCTGEATINPAGGPALHLRLVAPPHEATDGRGEHDERHDSGQQLLAVLLDAFEGVLKRRDELVFLDAVAFGTFMNPVRVDGAPAPGRRVSAGGCTRSPPLLNNWES